ncbi:MAG: hypothetical protein ACI3WR_05915 [Oscillospiraceae bacterium]
MKSKAYNVFQSVFPVSAFTINSILDESKLSAQAFLESVLFQYSAEACGRLGGRKPFGKLRATPAFIRQLSQLPRRCKKRPAEILLQGVGLCISLNDPYLGLFIDLSGEKAPVEKPLVDLQQQFLRKVRRQRLRHQHPSFEAIPSRLSQRCVM